MLQFAKHPPFMLLHASACIYYLLPTAYLVPSSPNFVTLMVEAIRSSETSIPTRATRSHIPEYDNIHNYLCENLKSCVLQIITFIIYK
jgi:hypothetical protein